MPRYIHAPEILKPQRSSSLSAIKLPSMVSKVSSKKIKTNASNSVVGSSVSSRKEMEQQTKEGAKLPKGCMRVEEYLAQVKADEEFGKQAAKLVLNNLGGEKENVVKQFWQLLVKKIKEVKVATVDATIEPEARGELRDLRGKEELSKSNSGNSSNSSSNSNSNIKSKSSKQSKYEYSREQAKEIYKAVKEQIKLSDGAAIYRGLKGSMYKEDLEELLDELFTNPEIYEQLHKKSSGSALSRLMKKSGSGIKSLASKGSSGVKGSETKGAKSESEVKLALESESELELKPGIKQKGVDIGESKDLLTELYLRPKSIKYKKQYVDKGAELLYEGIAKSGIWGKFILPMRLQSFKTISRHEIEIEIEPEVVKGGTGGIGGAAGKVLLLKDKSKFGEFGDTDRFSTKKAEEAEKQAGAEIAVESRAGRKGRDGEDYVSKKAESEVNKLQWYHQLPTGKMQSKFSTYIKKKLKIKSKSEKTKTERSKAVMQEEAATNESRIDVGLTKEAASSKSGVGKEVEVVTKTELLPTTKEGLSVTKASMIEPSTIESSTIESTAVEALDGGSSIKNKGSGESEQAAEIESKALTIRGESEGSELAGGAVIDISQQLIEYKKIQIKKLISSLSANERGDKSVSKVSAGIVQNFIKYLSKLVIDSSVGLAMINAAEENIAKDAKLGVGSKVGSVPTVPKLAAEELLEEELSATEEETDDKGKGEEGVIKDDKDKIQANNSSQSAGEITAANRLAIRPEVVSKLITSQQLAEYSKQGKGIEVLLAEFKMLEDEYFKVAYNDLLPLSELQAKFLNFYRDLLERLVSYTNWCKEHPDILSELGADKASVSLITQYVIVLLVERIMQYEEYKEQVAKPSGSISSYGNQLIANSKILQMQEKDLRSVKKIKLVRLQEDNFVSKVEGRVAAANEAVRKIRENINAYQTEIGAEFSNLLDEVQKQKQEGGKKIDELLENKKELPKLLAATIACEVLQLIGSGLAAISPAGELAGRMVNLAGGIGKKALEHRYAEITPEETGGLSSQLIADAASELKEVTAITQKNTKLLLNETEEDDQGKEEVKKEASEELPLTGKEKTKAQIEALFADEEFRKKIQELYQQLSQENEELVTSVNEMISKVGKKSEAKLFSKEKEEDINEEAEDETAEGEKDGDKEDDKEDILTTGTTLLKQGVVNIYGAVQKHKDLLGKINEKLDEKSAQLRELSQLKDNVLNLSIQFADKLNSYSAGRTGSSDRELSEQEKAGVLANSNLASLEVKEYLNKVMGVLDKISGIYSNKKMIDVIGQIKNAIEVITKLEEYVQSQYNTIDMARYMASLKLAGEEPSNAVNDENLLKLIVKLEHNNVVNQFVDFRNMIKLISFPFARKYLPMEKYEIKFSDSSKEATKDILLKVLKVTRELVSHEAKVGGKMDDITINQAFDLPERDKLAAGPFFTWQWQARAKNSKISGISEISGVSKEKATKVIEMETEVNSVERLLEGKKTMFKADIAGSGALRGYDVVKFNKFKIVFHHNMPVRADMSVAEKKEELEDLEVLQQKQQEQIKALEDKLQSYRIEIQHYLKGTKVGGVVVLSKTKAKAKSMTGDKHVPEKEQEKVLENLYFEEKAVKSDYMFDGKVYTIKHMPHKFSFSFAQDKNGEPKYKNSLYQKLASAEPMLSPYSVWQMQLIPMKPLARDSGGVKKDLEIGKGLSMSLVGSGSYIDLTELTRDEIVGLRLSQYYPNSKKYEPVKREEQLAKQLEQQAEVKQAETSKLSAEIAKETDSTITSGGSGHDKTLAGSSNGSEIKLAAIADLVGVFEDRHEMQSESVSAILGGFIVDEETLA